ncbi:PBP1A family penicillin-binding protein [Clostridium oceanicum]|uniref:Penicillin-binding protein 1A n=1 Tax=Clostridium oceanicum TaxID=1543 RepID=A0ABN1JW48_9CLOT
MSTNKRKKKKKKNKRKSFKIIFYTFLMLFLIGSISAGTVAYTMIKSAPKLDVNQILTLNEPSVLFDDKDKMMDKVITREQRIVVSSDNIPLNLKHAFVSIEDERFYKHKGVDPLRVLGAAFRNVINKIKRKPQLQGASTITQQLIKNTVLSSEISIKRKVQEMYLASKLEKELSKDKILESYMNTIFLGGRAFGVEAASKQYFNKKAKDLTLIECAYIAGVPQSPSIYYAFSSSSQNNPSTYLNRTKTVLSKMLDNEYINQAEYSNAINDLNNNKLQFKKPSSTTNKLNYEWFTTPAVQQVKEDLKKQYKYDDKQIQNMLLNGGLKIYTTMDKTLQDKTQKILNTASYLNSYNDNKGILQPQSGVVVMDYRNGEVKTLIGGRGNQPIGSFNRAASKSYLRAAGSSIKPLTVYSAAIDSKKANAATVIEDSPIPTSIGSKYGSNGAPYNPKNSPNKYSGYVTIRKGLKHSINTVAVKLEDKIGLSTGINYAKKFNIPLDNHDTTSMAAIALGELHKGTNPLIMAQAYGTFGNNGKYTNAKLYRKVVDRTGKVVLENKTETEQILSPQAAYITYDMMKGTVSEGGTGPAANFGTMEIAGKTGTSSYGKDLWFCGLTPYYSASVWIGNDNYSKPNGVFSSTAARLWGDIMKQFHSGLPYKKLSKPSGIVTANVDSVSGKLPTPLSFRDPRGSTVYSELFIDGTVPTTYDDIHVEARINKLTGNLASKFTPSFLVTSKVFIRRDYDPGVNLEDSQYVLPAMYDPENTESHKNEPNSQPRAKPKENGDNNKNPSDPHKKDENKTDDKNDTLVPTVPNGPNNSNNNDNLNTPGKNQDD